MFVHVRRVDFLLLYNQNLCANFVSKVLRIKIMAMVKIFEFLQNKRNIKRHIHCTVVYMLDT